MNKYTTPVLRCYGSLLHRTGADFQTSSSDGIFLDQQQVGTGIGSLDACVFSGQTSGQKNPPPPGATCR